MDVVIIGTAGRISDLLVQDLVSKRDTVRGFVPRGEQRSELAARSVSVVVGDLASMSVEALAAAFGNVESALFSAGTEGDSMEISSAIDDGATKVIEATPLASNRS